MHLKELDINKFCVILDIQKICFLYYWGEPERAPPGDPQLLRCLYNNIYIYIRPSPYRIFLNVSTRFLFTVTSRYFTGHYVHAGEVQSSSSWSCSLTSLLRDTEVSHHSLRPCYLRQDKSDRGNYTIAYIYCYSSL